MSAPYFKGLDLELIIADLFRKNGYTVVHNLKKAGKSGVVHQIDVYAEYKAPLHTSAIVIEAKSYEQPIDKDQIMKFVQIVDDLNADRGIFVTTSDFVASAIMTASQYSNIELWDRGKITSLVGALQLASSPSSNGKSSEPTNRAVKNKVRTVPAKLSYEQVQLYASEQVKKKAKGGFLGAGKVIEEVKDTALVLYPYYDLGMKVTVQHVEKTGLLKSEAVNKIVPCRVSIDALSGGIVNVVNTGLSYDYALPQITSDEAAILRIFRGGFEMKTILGVGLGEAKTKRLVNGLLTRGVLRASSTKPIVYSLTRPYPEDPTRLNSLREVFQISEIAIETNNRTKIIDPQIEPALVSNMIESYLNAKVEDIDLTFYPYYEIWYRRPDGSTRIEVLDGITGNSSERIANIIRPI